LALSDLAPISTSPELPTMMPRRHFVRGLAGIGLAAPMALARRALAIEPAPPIRVLVWDEPQPAQKEAYPNFLGNAIADYLKSCDGIDVRSRRLDDPHQGLADEDLAWAQVVVWWGHVRHAEITPETARAKIVEPIKAGKLSLIALHSAHWSTPFVEAINERTRLDARGRYPDPANGPPVQFEFIPPPGRFAPAHDSLVTPAYYALKQGAQVQRVRVDLPNCCFPDYRPDGAPSTITVLEPEHPVANGLPATFRIQHTEMYNEPFHVPQPDAVVFKETWEKGEWFRSGCAWRLGKGTVFYFRPGHETFAIYLQQEPLQVIENAVRWLGA
jgi:trehalose utilization protein